MKISIGVFGFGKTGSCVCEEIIKNKKFDLKWVIKKNPCEYEFASDKFGAKHRQGVINLSSKIDLSFFKKNPVDVVIDFSSRETLSQHYADLITAKIRIVTAISNYSSTQLKKIKKLSQKTSILYSPNITLGINWLIVISKILKKIVPDSDIEIVEEHFRQKKGVSGTALKIADSLGLNTKKHVNSIRVGGIVGKHEIIFGLPSQTIRLIHESINRAAFGRGAIVAAEWLIEKKLGLFNMEDVLYDKFKKASMEFTF